VRDEQHRQVVRRIAEARTRGDRVVVLRDRASFDGSFERVTVRLADGRGVRATVELDPGTYRQVHVLEELEIDLARGVVLGSAGAPRTFRDRNSWEDAQRRWEADSTGSATTTDDP
jgi:hypothetical protein